MNASILESSTGHEIPHQAPAHRRGGVDVWLLPLDAWRSRADDLLSVVDAAQRRRIATLRDAGLRRDRLLAHALHRMIVAQALGLPASLLPLYRSHTGQPRLALPRLHTSLSHAAGVVAVSLADCAVGVDVESRDTASLSPIADLVCAPAELATLPADALEREARLLSTWVCKEAALKASGTGLAREMNSFALGADQAVGLADADGRPLRLHLHMHSGASPWVAAVASESPVPPRWQWGTPAHPPFKFN